MKKVFISGSRKLGMLNKRLRARLDRMMSSGYMILVGDANGADRAMQQYLAKNSYPHVLVYCAGDICRNNVGNWNTRSVGSKGTHRGFQHFANRDLEMSKEADYGFMLWDGKSKGTLNNLLNLLARKRAVLVYLSPVKRFLTVQSREDLMGLLSLCDPEVVQNLDKSLQLSQRIGPEQSKLEFA